jgi:hypothetical protein
MVQSHKRAGWLLTLRIFQPNLEQLSRRQSVRSSNFEEKPLKKLNPEVIVSFGSGEQSLRSFSTQIAEV